MSFAATVPGVRGRDDSSMLRMRPAQVRRHLGALDPIRRQQACAAASTVIDGLDDFIARGRAPLAEALERTEVNEWHQYGSSDSDADTGGVHYFYHSHPARSTPSSEHGHFHLFARLPGAAEAERLVHLLAIGVDAHGMPGRLFTTNRWVTGGGWITANKAIAIAEKLGATSAQLNDPVERWLCAQLGVFMPQVEALLEHRDRRIEVGPRGSSVLEDRRTYILSQCRVSLAAQIASVEQAVASQP